MGRSKKNAEVRPQKRIRDAAEERAAKRQYRVVHPDVRERENAARQELHQDPIVRERENAARQELHETERLDPVVREYENVARQELHLDPIVREYENAARQELHQDPIVRERENVARQELHKTERLDPVVREYENAARQELHQDPIVRERENVARQELHETERLDPVVREYENAARQELHQDPIVRECENVARQELHQDPIVRERENADRQRRHREENNEIRRGAITDIRMSMGDFIDYIRNDKNGESFSLADKNVNNALALFYANMGFHKFGQHLKFRDPPPTLDQVVEQVIPDLNDALLDSKDVKEIELDFDRQHSYYPTNLPACGACGRRHNTPDDRKLKYCTMNLNARCMDLLIYSKEALELLKKEQQNSTIKIPINDSFDTKEICTTDIMSCYKMNPTKVFYLHPELVDGDGQFASTKLCPMCNKALLKDTLPQNCIASGIDFGICERIKELTKPNAAEQSIIARYRIFEEVVKIRPNAGSRTGNYTHYMIQGHSVIFSHDASERYMEAAINLIAQDRLQSSLSILFVGPKGEMDWLITKTKGSSTVMGRAFVIIQWLLLLQQTSPHYFNIPEKISDPSKWQEMDNLMRQANEHIIKVAQQVTREEDIMAEDSLGADIAETSRVSLGHRATYHENVPLFGDRDLPFVAVESQAEVLLVEGGTEGNEDADGDGNDDASFPLRYSLVTNRNMTQDYNASRNVQLNALAKEFLPSATDHYAESSSNMNDGDSSPEQKQEEQEELQEQEEGFDDILPNNFEAVDVESDDSSTNHEEKPPVSYRSNVPACDFDDSDYSLTCAFPHIFPLGRAYGRSTGTLNREQLNHLFTQFHQAPARDRKLLAYIFDNKRRTQTMFGVKVLSKGNSTAYRKMDEVVNALGFQDKLEAAINDPESKDARELLKTLHNCLTIAGKNQSYGSHELRNVVPTVKEISKSLGPPSAFVTCSLDSKGNPRAFRLSKAIVTNRDMPAHLPEEKLDEFIEKMVGDGNATQENNYFPFPMDESARAKEGIDNPIAYVQEFMAVVHSLLSVVIGIIPENFFSQISGKTTRKTVYLGNTKGALGHVFSYYGVIEANNRGDLHFHLICFGSLPPHVLTNFATCPNIRNKISEVLQSYYTTELDREFIIYKAIKNVLAERKRHRLPVFTLDKQNTANLLKAERATPVDGLTDHNSKEKIRKRTRMQDSQQQLHNHIRFTCSKGIMGKTGCRYSRPYACNEEINVVRLSARQKLPDTDEYDPEDGGKGDESWISTNVEDSSVWESKSPIDSLDRTVFYWDLARPYTIPIEEPFPQCANYMEGSLVFSEHEKQQKARMVANQLCDSGPSFLRSNFDAMVSLSLDDLLAIFCAVNHEIFDMNGKLVEHSSVISDVTRSHNNVAILGSSEQGKAAAFYLGPYFSKEKFGFEESLLIMALANKHIHTFESKAEDTGTNSRNTKYFIQRCLNQHCLKMEVSDYQMAAALLSMPVIIRSHIFSFVDPHSAITYMEDKMHEEKSTDTLSSTNTSIHNNDSNDNTSESENSLREEAVLPETDRVNLACPREFGYTKIYQVEQGLNGNAGTKMAIPKVSLYYERGKELEHLNMIEYECLIQIEKKKTEKDGDADDCTMHNHEVPGDFPQLNTKKPGRQSSPRFEYNTNFEMQRLFQQRLAAKQSLPFVIGNAPPKRPGNRPLQLNGESVSDYEKRLDSWQRQADIFARYYLLLFRPTSRNLRESDFTFESLQNWIADCRASKNWLKEFRLVMFNNRLNGMSISSTNKKLITAYRGRCRTIWTDEERYNNNEYFASQRAQRAEDLEASGLAPAEYNLEHNDLGNDINKRMKKQENDISYIQTALEGLLPPSASHNRMTPGATTNNAAPLHRVGQQAASELSLDLDASAMEKIYSGDSMELNIHAAPVGNGGLNGVTQTEVEAEADPTNSKTHKLEPDQTVVFDEVVRLMLQGNGREETRPKLVLGPAGTGKTRLIFAILDAARSKGKEFICTSFNAITATAIGGDTFSGDFFWRPELHQQRPSPFSKDELIKFLHNHGFGIKFAARDFNDIVVGIIVEEISTFSPEMVCHLDIRLRQVTKIDKPFGGLIVLMVGDFGQLGPVEASPIPNAVVNVCQYLSNRNKSIFIRNEMARQNQIRNRKKKKNRSSKPGRAKSSIPSATEEFKDRYSEGHPYRKGVELLTSARLFHLTTQKRAQDPVHRDHIESMFRGEKLTFQMFNHYEELKGVDMEESGDFCDAPILCSTNRERHTINGIMAPIRASTKGVCAIRWNADLKPYWDQKPSDQYISQIMYSDPCFWEYFVPDTDGYLSDNLCKPLGLVNGTHIRYHSLSFDSYGKYVQFQELVANTGVGEVLSLPLSLRPEAINVELINLSEETQQKWLQHDLSLLPDKIVIPLPCRRKFSKTPRPIIVPGAPNGEYKCSKIRVKNFFPVEPGFAITIYKAQGRTIPKVILAISERQGDGCGLNYRSIYVGFSRVKHKDDIRLLLFHDDGSRTSLTYLTKLTADPCNLAFVDGYDINGGEFDVKKVLDNYARLTEKP